MSTENKKKSGLSKELSFGKKTAKYPTKKTINFVSDQQDKNNPPESHPDHRNQPR